MKAITLHQPWASLIACGAKTIETRSWTAPNGLIGERIAIHAAANFRGIDALEDDLQQEGDWNFVELGDYQVSYCWRTGDTGSRCELEMQHTKNDREAAVLPLGAVVASAVLEACVPIVVTEPQRPKPDRGSTPWPVIANPQDGGNLVALWSIAADGYEFVQYLDQRPYGDFADNRWAWLLTDIKPTSERCPQCWGDGLINLRGPAYMSVDALQSGAVLEGDRCPTCDLVGHCDPVPAKGAQRVWNWSPE